MLRIYIVLLQKANDKKKVFGSSDQHTFNQQLSYISHFDYTVVNLFLG